MSTTTDTLTPEELALCGVESATLVEVIRPPESYWMRRAMRGISAVAYIAAAEQAETVAEADELCERGVELVHMWFEEQDRGPRLDVLRAYYGAAPRWSLSDLSRVHGDAALCLHDARDAVGEVAELVRDGELDAAIDAMGSARATAARGALLALLWLLGVDQ